MNWCLRCFHQLWSYHNGIKTRNGGMHSSCRKNIYSFSQRRTFIYNDRANLLTGIQRRLEPATSRLRARHHNHQGTMIPSIGQCEEEEEKEEEEKEDKKKGDEEKRKIMKMTNVKMKTKMHIHRCLCIHN